MKKLILLILPISLFAQSWSGTQKITNDFRKGQNFFGNALAVDGDFAVVGTSEESRDTLNLFPIAQSGIVHIYKKDNAQNWQLFQKLQAPARSSTARFGWSVAIDSNKIAIGAAFESIPGYNSAGAVYVFNLVNNRWVFQQRITPLDTSGNVARFGSDVALYENYLLIGASHHSTDSANASPMGNAGAAYFFENVAGTWVQKKKVSPKMRLNSSRFGTSVALHGEYALVGAPEDAYNTQGVFAGTTAGAAFAYKRNAANGSWTETQKIGVVQISEYYGYSLDLNTNYALIGAYEHSNGFTAGGAAELLKRNSSGQYVVEQQLTVTVPFPADRFGRSVSLSDNYALIGADGDDEDENDSNTISNAGAAFVYQLDQANDSLVFMQKIVATDRDSIFSYLDTYGYEVAISDDAAFVQARYDDEDVNNQNYFNNAGSIYAYKLCQPNIASTQDSICDGDTLILGTSILTTSGNYSETFMASNGCDSIASLTLTVLATSSATLSETICKGDSMLFGNTYYSTAGTYLQALAAANGCDSVVQLNLTVTEIDTTITATLNNDLLSSNQLGASYQWLDCANNFAPIPNATNQSFSPAATGNYAVQITLNGCIDTSACVYGIPIGEIELELGSGITLFPNPVSEELFIQQKNAELLLIEVCDISGRVLKRVWVNEQKQAISLNELPSGIYLVRVHAADGLKTFRIEKI